MRTLVWEYSYERIIVDLQLELKSVNLVHVWLPVVLLCQFGDVQRDSVSQTSGGQPEDFLFEGEHPGRLAAFTYWDESILEQ